MKMKHKPLMGTKLVPNIRNIEGCFKYGGQWDREHKLCIAHESEEGGCTAPINGAMVCWEAVDYDEGHWGSRAEVIPWRHDYDDMFDYDEWNIHDEVYESQASSLEEAKSIAMSTAKDMMGGDIESGLFCCSLKGRVASCDEPNVVIDNNCTKVAETYREILKLKKLDDFIRNKEKNKIDVR
jgi:hypothetical protein